MERVVDGRSAEAPGTAEDEGADEDCGPETPAPGGAVAVAVASGSSELPWKGPRNAGRCDGSCG